MRSEHFSPDTLEFIRLLARHEVRYLIVGGQAVIYYGHARFTGDVDFFYSMESKNAERLFAALKEFWGGDVPGVGKATDLQHKGYVIQFGRPPNRIDLLASIDGVEFEDAWASRQWVPIENANFGIWMLSLEMLIRNKRSSDRPKDRDDLLFLDRNIK